jgi:hypothetical protein
MADKPSDIDSVRKLDKDLQQFSDFKKALPVLRPILSLVGVDVSRLQGPLDKLTLRQNEFAALVKLMDRFNELFAPRGWIAYDRLNTEAAMAAIAAAEGENMAQAEEILVQHYSADQVSIQLRALVGLESFRPRMRLAELALTDYREGRYHACVPVVLALLDGMVNELGNQGFFSQNVDLTAWDSIAACSSGLNQLKALLIKPRRKTTEGPIEVPYRNGIHHGMDLGYDTPLVAAKSWAALFATADWARRIEQGKKEAPPPEPQPTLRDILNQVQRNAETKARLEAWKPRRPEDMPGPGSAPDSPEAALVEFLNAWKSQNYGVMAKRTDPFGSGTVNARAGELRDYYKDLHLHDFTIQAIVDTAPAATEITVRGCGIQYEKPFDTSGTFRLVSMDQHGNPVIHGDPCGTWFVMIQNPWQQAVR